MPFDCSSLFLKNTGFHFAIILFFILHIITIIEALDGATCILTLSNNCCAVALNTRQEELAAYEFLQ